MKRKVVEHQVLTEICPLQIEGRLDNGMWFHLRLRNFRIWVGYYQGRYELNHNITDSVFECGTQWEDTMDLDKALFTVEWGASLNY